MSKKPAKTPEELDEEELREVEGKVKEVLDLMTARHHRDRVDQHLEMARSRRDEHAGNKQAVFHISGSHHVPTTMHTKTALDLAETLKLRIQLGQYARELDDSLERLSLRYVAVLERMLGRSRY
jgi:6,7-dimethyl-8-ribityllumazine synthase